MNNTHYCILCCDAFTSSDAVYRTMCGHIGHYNCIVHGHRLKKCASCKQRIDFEGPLKKVSLCEMQMYCREQHYYSKSQHLAKRIILLESELYMEKKKQASKVATLEMELKQTVFYAQRDKSNLEQRIKQMKEDNKSDQRVLEKKLATCMEEKRALQIRVTELQDIKPPLASNSVMDSNKENVPTTSSAKPKKLTKGSNIEPKRIKSELKENTIDPKKGNSPAKYIRKYNLRPR